MNNTGNKHIVLVVGVPSSGKTTSLMNVPNQERIAYLNTDLKELPFKSKFQELSIIDPKDITEAIRQIEEEPSIESGILDTLTFLMNQFEQQYVLGATDTRAMWQEYASFYQKFLHSIKSGTKNYAILAHVKDILNEKDHVMETKIPVKGAVGHIGVEADFTTIIASKRMPITKLEDWANPLLNITDDEREDGFKYVFQTRIDKETIGERMRSAIGLWDRKEKYIDNDVSKVFTRLNEYYK